MGCKLSILALEKIHNNFLRFLTKAQMADRAKRFEMICVKSNV